MPTSQDVNEAKRTKDTWVRGQMPSGEAVGSSGLLEGWLLASTTKRGAMMIDAPDPLGAQTSFQKQVRRASMRRVVSCRVVPPVPSS